MTTLPVVSASPECACATCRSCCERFPGWMTPRDVVRLARHLNVSVFSLFETHLAFDRYFALRGCGRRDVWVVLPASGTRDFRPGELFARPWSDGYRYGCQMYVDGRCTIHAAKPRECRETLACADQAPTSHERIARTWNRPAARRFMDMIRAAVVAQHGGHEPYSWNSP